MAQLSFDHLLNLSFSFHTHRKTGEIFRILDRGSAINSTLEVSYSICLILSRTEDCAACTISCHTNSLRYNRCFDHLLFQIRLVAVVGHLPCDVFVW
jgi:ABC-type transport system involved in Fe-S cluster assembly fused permease/ATPase subunit